MSIQTSTTAAKERAEAIRSGIDATAAALQEVPRLVAEAFKADDWRTLSYESWQDYVSGEFGTSLIKLDKATRKTWTLTLADAGMSTREIAPVTNVSAMQVSRDSRSVTKVTAARSPDEKLSDELHAAMHKLGHARDMMQKGASTNSLAQHALQEIVRLVREIINTGAMEEAS